MNENVRTGAWARITVVGRLGRDPEIKHLDDGRHVVRFGVAVGRGPGKPTTWWNVEAWGELALSVIGSLCKGCKVMVIGTPHVVQWKGDDGRERTRLEINIAQGGSIDFMAAPSEKRPPLEGPPRVPAREVVAKEHSAALDYVGAVNDDPDPIGSGLGFVDDNDPAF